PRTVPKYMGLKLVHKSVPVRPKGGYVVGERGDVILEQSECSPCEQTGCDNFHCAPNEKRYGLVLEPDDDGDGQRKRRGRRTQQVWTTEVEYELHTTIRRD